MYTIQDEGCFYNSFIPIQVVVSLNEEGALNAPQFPTELNLCAAIVTITNSFVEAGRDLSALKTFLSHLVEKRLFTEYFDMGEEHIDPLPIQTNSVRQYFSWLVQTYNTSSNTRPQRRTYPDFFSDPVWLEAVKVSILVFA